VHGGTTPGRNWRKRVYVPAADSAGVEAPRPFDLRHSFASLLIDEGRHSIVDIAAHLGHDATLTLSTYAHVVAELRDAPKLSAEEQISRRAARAGRRKYGQRADSGPADDARYRPKREKAPHPRGFSEEPTGDSNPPTPSLREPSGGDFESEDGPNPRQLPELRVRWFGRVERDAAQIRRRARR
jgi:hypothetical protein